MFHPGLSWLMVSVCCPAGRFTAAVTFVHVCHAPVAGTLMFPLRLVPEEFEICNPSVTALMAATRNVTLYVPADATFTVYRNHCPAAVQPMLYPPPLSVVTSRSTPSER